MYKDIRFGIDYICEGIRLLGLELTTYVKGYGIYTNYRYEGIMFWINYIYD